MARGRDFIQHLRQRHPCRLNLTERQIRLGQQHVIVKAAYPCAGGLSLANCRLDLGQAVGVGMVHHGQPSLEKCALEAKHSRTDFTAWPVHLIERVTFLTDE